MSNNKDFSQAMAYINTPRVKEEEVKEEVKKEVVSKPETKPEPVKEVTKVDYTENRSNSFSMTMRPSMFYLLKKYSNEHDISMSRVVERAICQYLDV